MIAIAGGASKIFMLVSAPILTQELGPSPYGAVALLVTVTALAVYSSITGVEADALTTVFNKFNDCTGAKVTFNGNKEFEAQLPVRPRRGEDGDRPGERRDR